MGRRNKFDERRSQTKIQGKEKFIFEIEYIHENKEKKIKGFEKKSKDFLSGRKTSA